jgi:hypothetical protein
MKQHSIVGRKSNVYARRLALLRKQEWWRKKTSSLALQKLSLSSSWGAKKVMGRTQARSNGSSVLGHALAASDGTGVEVVRRHGGVIIQFV